MSLVTLNFHIDNIDNNKIDKMNQLSKMLVNKLKKLL